MERCAIATPNVSTTRDGLSGVNVRSDGQEMDKCAARIEIWTGGQIMISDVRISDAERYFPLMFVLGINIIIF